MKKTVLVFGLISGAISSGMMIGTLPFTDKLGHGSAGLVLGYTTMVLSFLLVYFGIRSYRDNVGGGKISFGRAFAVGISITLIACVFYVATWEIIYFNFMPHFMDGYFAAQIHKVEAAGLDPATTAARIATIKSSQESYQKPLVNMAYTFMEPLPVGLVITLVSAAILRRKTVTQPAAATAAVSAT